MEKQTPAPYWLDQMPEYRPSTEQHAETPELRPADIHDAPPKQEDEP